MASAVSPPPSSPQAPRARKRQFARFRAFLRALCRLQGPDGAPQELEGKTRNLSEGGTLLLLSRALPPGSQLAVQLDTQVGEASRTGHVVWVGKPEPANPGGTVVPHGIIFGQTLARAFVEAVVTRKGQPDARDAPEVQVDAEAVRSRRAANLSCRGVFIRTAEPLPVNRTLTVRFHLPGVPEPFRVLGRVIWSNPEPGRSYPQGMGLSFVDLPRERGDQIGAFVAQVRREQGLERVTELLGRPSGGEPE